MVEYPVQLVDRVRPEGIAHLRAIECDPDRALVDCAVVGDVGEVEAIHDSPPVRIEDL